MKKILILLSALIMFSCSKNESINSKNNTTIFKSNQIGSDSIGIIHNEGLDYIIERYNTPASNLDSIFNDINDLQKAFFLSKGYEQENLSSELKSLVSTGDGVSWLNALYADGKINISIDLKGYLINILNYTYNGASNPFSQVEYYAYLDSVHTSASISLSQSELEILESHISVAKSGFEYWFNNDGSPRMILSSLSRAPINWWQTLGADCIGGIVTCGSPTGFVGASAFDIYYQIV